MGQSESSPPPVPPETEQERQRRLEREDTAARITYWRKKANLKPVELAAAAGLSPSQISRYEAALGTPGQMNLGRICKACGIDRRIFWSPVDLPPKGEE